MLLPIGFLSVLVALAFLSLRFGVDSRDGVMTPPQPPLGERGERA